MPSSGYVNTINFQSLACTGKKRADASLSSPLQLWSPLVKPGNASSSLSCLLSFSAQIFDRKAL